MDLLEDLETLKFESGIHEEDQSWLYLLGRSHGLMTKACAHATFFCKLLHNMRESFSRKLVPEKRTSKCRLTGLCEETQDDDALKVGIIGGGHLGKQLAHTLLQFVPIPAENLRISTRRPETLDEFKKLGIQCFYQNASLVGWANVVFLCCLPSQLPNICVEIQTRLGKDCIVYSFVSAIPVSRLKLLLNHTNILRPQYQCAEDLAHIWGANKEITAALQDPVIIQATCPYSPAGGISLNIKWLEGMFYALLNFCTAKDMPHSQVLWHLSELFPSQHLEACKKDEASPLKFQAQDFVSKIYAKNLSQKRLPGDMPINVGEVLLYSLFPSDDLLEWEARPFPLFDLTAVQLKETPFSQYLSNSTTFQDRFTHLYYDSFGISLTKEQEEPEVSTGSPSQ